MKITIKYLDEVKEYSNKSTIIIGSSSNSDFVVEELKPETIIKLVYTQKYNNYVLINSAKDKELLFNNKEFSKILVPPTFTLNTKNLPDEIRIDVEKQEIQESTTKPPISKISKVQEKQNTNKQFDNDIESQRVAIIKEIGYKIVALKEAIKSANIISVVLNICTIILSIVCSFGITNFLLGLKVDTTSSVLNLTTNVGFLVCISAITIAISFILKYGVSSYLEVNHNKKFGESDLAQKFIIGISGIFLFMVYIINLFYYKSIPGFVMASFFVSLLFVGALATVSIAGGYFKNQLKNYHYELTNSEYREDFEGVMKNYRKLIENFVNKLSQNRLNSVKSNLLNCQFRMIIEIFIGILTSPFLAYGVSNTLASCFPEAANWVRISGLRFSPIFLVLATFLIIFAFFSFVRGFTISKQIKGSEIIKLDGFHDYNSHGVTILGIDSMRNLNKEKNVVLFIACFIILIEFTMNVSYFITEIGGDIQGMFLSFVTALVPTALLIAETHLLSSTMFKINNYTELLDLVD